MDDIRKAQSREVLDKAVDDYLRYAGLSEDPGNDRELNAAKAASLAQQADATSEVSHRLYDLAPLLPDNPRRVKRLVNMISVYQISAQATLGLDADTDPRWQGLALWILLMAEEPDAWVLLCDRPELADLKGDTSALPDPLKRDSVRMILDYGVQNDSPDREEAWLTKATVADFARLTPAPPPDPASTHSTD
ncbi:MAG: hypothetical protein AAGF94_12095 [Pseudomonadota bacterium]